MPRAKGRKKEPQILSVADEILEFTMNFNIYEVLNSQRAILFKVIQIFIFFLYWIRIFKYNSFTL